MRINNGYKTGFSVINEIHNYNKNESSAAFVAPPISFFSKNHKHPSSMNNKALKRFSENNYISSNMDKIGTNNIESKVNYNNIGNNEKSSYNFHPG